MIADMHWAQKLWYKKSHAIGTVGISFLNSGIAVAISDFVDTKQSRLKHCEFIPTLYVDQNPDVLRNLVSLHNLTRYDCNLVLSVNNYNRVNIEAPAVSDNEIAAAIYWKIIDLFDFPIDQAFIDYYALPISTRDPNHKMLDIFACPKQLIHSLAEKSSSAGLQLKIIDVQETALRNLAKLLPENKSGVAMLIMHELSGTLLIQKDGVIYLAHNFEVGYRDLNLATDLGESYLLDIKRDNLAMEIKRSLDYATSYYGITPVSGLAVVPLVKNTQALSTLLNDKLGITATIINISELVGSDLIMDDLTQSRCSAVIGTTLRDIG